jgi:hypothetical protein
VTEVIDHVDITKHLDDNFRWYSEGVAEQVYVEDMVLVALGGITITEIDMVSKRN